MITPVRSVAPSADIVRISTIKDHLRIDGAEEEFYIAQLTAAAIAHLDGWTGILGRCLGVQTWRSFATSLASHRLPFPDVQSAVVKYLDPAGAEQTLAATAYRVGNDASGGYIEFDPAVALPATAVREDAVRIEAVYGFDPLPPPLATAVLFIVAGWYEGRVGADRIPPAAEALIAPWRQVGI